MDRQSGPIVFFDGVCGLCNGSVDWLMARDRRAVLRFAPLQGETAQRTLGPLDDDPETWSMVLVDETGRYRRSDAAIKIVEYLGGPWAIAGRVIGIVPRGLRDAGYRWIARNRYRWFGQHETCRIPTPEERSRFLP
ncbi:MAG: thiol-disulfide oxidoreductase DCC family protein [Chloroflexota bacterium]